MTEQPPGPSAPISAHTDPAGQVPWAMQLVVRVEKTAPPARTAACEATATAVAALLAHPHAAAGGPWFAAIDRWTDGRIRKHARRARGAAWDKVQDLPGLTVDVAGVQVRAFVPGPTDAIARDIAKLQLSGTELDDPAPLQHITPVPGGPVVVSICPDPHLPFGKAAAAAGHAAQIAADTMTADRYQVWLEAGFPVTVEHPAPATWQALVGRTPVRIVDAGFTAVPAGTTTALARWA